MLNVQGHKEVAVKTGTSNDLRDNLTIGYNQNFLVAVWVGNNDNSPMDRVASGVTGASPIFNKIMSALLAQQENHDWETPQGLVQLPICPYTGTLACSGCPIKMEWFLEENKPEKACQSSWFEKEEGEEDQNSEGSTNEIQIPVEQVNLINTRGNSEDNNKEKKKRLILPN
jgi:membrane carboxypeptidase/penicillin-binding protein PbpC